MSTTYSVIIPTGSTNGRAIQVNGTTTGTATTLHTAVTGTSSFDEQYWWVQNLSSGAISTTIQLGGTTSSDAITASVPGASGMFQLCPGVRLNNGVVTSAYAASAGFILVFGNVNRIV